MTLTYRTSESGKMHAAYSRDVRIGYVEQRAGKRFIYQCSLVMPEGGHAMGKCDTEEEAKDMLQKTYDAWVVSAGLQLIPPPPPPPKRAAPAPPPPPPPPAQKDLF